MLAEDEMNDQKEECGSRSIEDLLAMLAENENNQPSEEPDSETIEGLLAREYERLTPSSDVEQADIDNTPLNFFRGRVTDERLRHESAARRGGLAHWKHRTSRQRDYNDQVLHGGMGQPLRAGGHLQAVAITYGAANRSPGMGLEAENFQSFMTGSHQIIRAIGPATPVQNASANTQAPLEDQEVAEIVRPTAPSVAQSDLPLLDAAGGEIYNYRRKKSATLTNLLAHARSILKA